MGHTRLVVLGAGQTGKSALTIQFIQGRFVEYYDGTVEDSYRKTVEVDTKQCPLDIVDTAGQEEYRSAMSVYYKRGNGFLLVYSVLCRSSFDEVCSMYEALIKEKPDFDPERSPGTHVPIVLVGNKVDMVGSKADRAVLTSEGEAKAKEWSCKFFETSAKTRENVLEAFYNLVRLVLAWSRELDQQRVRQSSAVQQLPPPPTQADSRDDGKKEQTKPKKVKEGKKKKCIIL